jgi:Protein of unknown function (DUF3300)
MRRILVVSLLLSSITLVSSARAQQEVSPYGWFSPDQLDNLLAPVALYPDPLLAQVLVAATYPGQVDDAARFVRADPDPAHIDIQWWDVSVRAVAHYRSVLDMMDDDLDWTTALGQAYVNQPDDVMASVQRLRAQAAAVGNLVSSPQLEVVRAGGIIQIWPAQPRYIYVPVYDPAIVYFRPAPFLFGLRLVIGAWLSYDFDWHSHRIFYHGWNEDHGWVARSRPYIHRTTVYVNERHRNVVVNRNVVKRPVNYPNLDRYSDVRRDTKFQPPRGERPVVSKPPPSPPPINNKIIRRNIDTNDPRLKEFRGHRPPAGQAEQQPRTAFTPSQGTIPPKQASERGHESRSQASRPPARRAPEKKTPGEKGGRK